MRIRKSKTNKYVTAYLQSIIIYLPTMRIVPEIKEMVN